MVKTKVPPPWFLLAVRPGAAALPEEAARGPAVTISYGVAVRGEPGFLEILPVARARQLAAAILHACDIAEAGEAVTPS